MSVTGKKNLTIFSEHAVPVHPHDQHYDEHYLLSGQQHIQGVGFALPMMQ
jgi:hypothetical protein